MGITAEELYKERENRVNDAIQLKIPDRVPISTMFGYFPAKYNGISCETAFYDYEKWLIVYKKTLLDFKPDIAHLQPFFPGNVLELLESREIKWPGHGVSPYHSHQLVYGEWMKSNEYEAFLADISDYMLRIYIPRLYGSLEPLRLLPPLSSALFDYRAVAQAMSIPEVIGALETFLKASHELSRWCSRIGESGLATFGNEIQKMGFPLFTASHARVPFDLIADHLRGLLGVMQDMFRQPNQLIAACEKVLPIILDRAIALAKRSGNPRIFIVLHNGSDSLMSPKQFDTFYWPTFKKLILALVAEDLTPCVFFNGDCTSRLEHLLELPRGKILIHFESTDIFKAKEILKDYMCIEGNVPLSLLKTGTPSEVKDYCRRLIDVVGNNGGLIMNSNGPIDDVKQDNLEAMYNFTREYGTYK
jgi:hypothetical protein